MFKENAKQRQDNLGRDTLHGLAYNEHVWKEVVYQSERLKNEIVCGGRLAFRDDTNDGGKYFSHYKHLCFNHKLSQTTCKQPQLKMMTPCPLLEKLSVEASF